MHSISHDIVAADSPFKKNVIIQVVFEVQKENTTIIQNETHKN